MPWWSHELAPRHYHVFRAAMLTRSAGLNARVIGAPTAGYFVPSALLRESVAIMRENLVINLVAVGLLTLMWASLFMVLATNW